MCVLDFKPTKGKLINFPDDFLDKVKKKYPDDKTMEYLVRQGHGYMGSRLHSDARLDLSVNDILNYINHGASGIKELKSILKNIQVAQKLYDEFRIYYDKHVEGMKKQQ